MAVYKDGVRIDSDFGPLGRRRRPSGPKSERGARAAPDVDNQRESPPGKRVASELHLAKWGASPAAARRNETVEPDNRGGPRKTNFLTTQSVTKDDKRTLTPKLRFPEFRDAPGWEEQPISSHLTESRVDGSNGRVAKKLTVKLWGKGVTEKVEAVRGSENTRYYRRRAGQFIYSKLDFLNRAFGIIPSSLDGYESTVDLPCFDIAHSLNSKFLLEYVQREEFYKRHGELADGGRKAKRIQVESFLSFPISLPPARAEQQKIADCLTSLDELIAGQGRKVEALKVHKQCLMQRLFPRAGETLPRLRFPGFRDAPEWEPTSLEELVDIQSGSTPYKANPAFWNGSIPWVSAKDMKQLFLDETEDHISNAAVDDGSRVVPAGTLLMLTRGMTLLKHVPICVLRREMSFNQDVKALRSKDGVSSLFLAFLLVGNKPRLLRMVDIAGHGTGKLDTDELKAFRLVSPQPVEQRRIADCLSALDALIAAEADKLAALKTDKRGLMRQLFPSPEGA